LDKKVEFTDFDEMLLPLDEAKEYAETEDMECVQEPAETWDREIQPTDGSTVVEVHVIVVLLPAATAW